MPNKRSKSSDASTSDRNARRQVKLRPNNRFLYILKDERERILKNLEEGLEEKIKRTAICENSQELTMVLLKLLKFKARLFKVKQSHNMKHTALGKMIDIVRDDICSMIRRESVNPNELELVSKRTKDIGMILQNIADEFEQDDVINVEIGPGDASEDPVSKQKKEFSSDSCQEYSSFTTSADNSLSLSSGDEYSTPKKANVGQLGDEFENKNEEYKLLNEVTLTKKCLPEMCENLKSDTVVHTAVENNFKGSDSVNVIDKLFVDKETQDCEFKVDERTTSKQKPLNWISSEDQSKYIQKATSYDDFVLYPGFNWEKPKIPIPLKKSVIDQKTWKYHDSTLNISKCVKTRETNTAGGDYPSQEACSQTEYLSSPFQPVYFLKVYYSNTSFKNVLPKESRVPKFPEETVVVDSTKNHDCSAFVTCRADPEKGVAHFVLVQQGDKRDGVEIIPVESASKLDEIRNLWVRKLKDFCCEVKSKTVVCRSPGRGNTRK